MTRRRLDDSGKPNRSVERFLDRILVQMMSTLFGRARIFRKGRGWKNILPPPFAIGIGKFAFQGVR